MPEKEQTMKDVKNLLQTKVQEVYENNTHDFFIIKGQSGEEKDDQIVNANCKIVYFTQYMKQVGDSSIENTTTTSRYITNLVETYIAVDRCDGLINRAD